MFVMPPCYNAGDTIYFPFDTYDSNGGSVTITGLAVTDIEVYKDGSTTQRASDNGYTLLDTDGIDFDGSTGLHGFSIDTSDNSDAGFWADGHTYWVHINAITVDGQTVRFTYHLALGYTLRPATAGRKLVVDSSGLADANTVKVGPTGSGTAQTARDLGASVLLSPGTGTGQISLSSGAVTVGTNNDKTGYRLSATGVDDLWDELRSGHAVVGSYGEGVLIAAGAINTSAFTNNAITAAKIATDAIGAAQLAADAVSEIQAGLSTLDAAGVRTALGMASANLDTQLGAIAGYIDTEVAAIKAKTDNLPSDPADASDIAAAFVALTAKLLAYVQLLARKDAAIASDNATELGEINADEGSGAGGYDNTSDSVQAIRDRGDAAWGSAGADPQVLLDTDVDTVTDQTHLILTDGAADDDVYNNQTVVLFDASNTPSVRKITDYDQATKTITLDSAADFTVAPSDAVKIFVTPPGTTAPTAAEVAEAVRGPNTSNDPTRLDGQIRRDHAGSGGNKRTQNPNDDNAPIEVWNEAGNAVLFTLTPTVDGTGKTTWNVS